MKVDEAPEKIYINPLPNPSDGYIGIAWDEPHKTMVEYTRTDAFIEKACKKLEKCMYDNLMFQGRLHRKEVIETFIEDFKKHMEGE